MNIPLFPYSIPSPNPVSKSPLQQTVVLEQPLRRNHQWLTGMPLGTCTANPDASSSTLRRVLSSAAISRPRLANRPGFSQGATHSSMPAENLRRSRPLLGRPFGKQDQNLADYDGLLVGTCWRSQVCPRGPIEPSEEPNIFRSRR